MSPSLSHQLSLLNLHIQVKISTCHPLAYQTLIRVQRSCSLYKYTVQDVVARVFSVIAMHAPSAYLAFVLSAYTLCQAISIGEGFVQGVKYRTQGTSSFSLISGDTLIFLLVVILIGVGSSFAEFFGGILEEFLIPLDDAENTA